MPGAHGTDPDRRVVRFVVDTLVTPDQVELVRAVLARALCGADDDHPGPCRVAWDVWHLDEGGAARGAALAAPDVDAVRAALGALETLPSAAATADLLDELGSAAGTAPAQGLVGKDAVRPPVEGREPAVVPEAPAQRHG
ncbi:hypothetical protein [Kineosporia sp. A_224]|uniref:hypothetical protein n=1 Tax=Kineosporia sp. A_224 TaxID=1962180 RepID=UPI001179BA17|nr:hypothetical protein [Kineosporia sp. A_224]